MTTFQIIGVIFMAVVAVGIILGLRKGDRRDMRCVLMMLTLLAMGQGAFAQTSWSVSKYSESGNTCRFKIERTGDKSQAVTVKYRTVSLSAFEGQHFTAVSGDVSFLANEDTKYVDVTEN